MSSDSRLIHKKFLILNCIQLGMSLDRAAIIAELTEEETKQIQEDKSFEKEIITAEANLEKDLLDRYQDCMKIAVTKGNSKPLEWMLEKINPERWGGKTETSSVVNNIIISEKDAKLK